MMCFGFGWGRGMAYTALRTLLAAFIVLFGCSVALALILYATARLNIAAPSMGAEVANAAFSNPKILLAIALGWLGTAFLAEATSIANSVTHSQLTNQAAMVITSGAMATGLGLLKAGKTIPGKLFKTSPLAVETAKTPKEADSAAMGEIKDRLSQAHFDNQ